MGQGSGFIWGLLFSQLWSGCLLPGSQSQPWTPAVPRSQDKVWSSWENQPKEEQKKIKISCNPSTQQRQGHHFWCLASSGSSYQCVCMCVYMCAHMCACTHTHKQMKSVTWLCAMDIHLAILGMFIHVIKYSQHIFLQLSHGWLVLIYKGIIHLLYLAFFY